MGKKKRNKVFSQIPLPENIRSMLVHTTEKHLLTGAQLKEWGYEAPDGQVIIDAMLYKYDFAVIRDMNHERRMRRAFERNGYEGLNSYFESLLKALKPEAVGNNMLQQ